MRQTRAQPPPANSFEGPARRASPFDAARGLIDAAFAYDLEQQLPLFDGVSLADIAHILVLTEDGLIPAAPGEALLSALLVLHARPADFIPEPAHGDLYTNREAWLAARTSAVAYLGTGRTRREAVTTGYHLTARQLLVAFAAALCRLLDALLERAAEHRDALMPDYTYLRAAQPSTFGHYLLSFAYPVLRDLERARALFARLNLAPVGAGGTSGSRLAIDRERVARMLGFDGCVVHTRDAMWQADTAMETAGVIAAAAVTQSRLAEDLQVFSTDEFGLLEIAEAHARASVMMPQKKNPFALPYMRATANEMIALQTAVAAAARTTTGQIDSRMAAYAQVPRGLDRTARAALLMADVVHALRFDRERGEALVDKGFVMASDLAEEIMSGAGIAYSDAYHIVRRLTEKLKASGLTLSRAEPRDLINEAARAVLGQCPTIDLGDLAQTLNPARAVAARRGLGGAAPDSVKAMIEACRARSAEYAAWCAQVGDALRNAEEALLKRALAHAGDA